MTVSEFGPAGPNAIQAAALGKASAPVAAGRTRSPRAAFLPPPGGAPPIFLTPSVAIRITGGRS